MIRKTITSNFKINNEAWNPAYKDLKNEETENLTNEIVKEVCQSLHFYQVHDCCSLVGLIN